mmetsp:Transcript_22573/g.73377  ORF Transcript_22573/g.73377 Transcript_22573/m.73377 type:complete len:236 (+) Transcript_22573:671-1378(+)
MPWRTTYTQKYVTARPQMNGLLSTFWNRFWSRVSSFPSSALLPSDCPIPSVFAAASVALSDSASPSFASSASPAAAAAVAAAPAPFAASISAACSSTGLKPHFSGESRRKVMSKPPATNATSPGAYKPHDQPKLRAAKPARMGAEKPPRLCAMFHIPQYVPRSLVANHAVRILAHEGAPKPWRMPFMAQSAQNTGSALEAPNAMLISPVAMSPPASIVVGDSLSPTTPLTNLLHP